MKDQTKQLTSVKLDPTLFEEFKINAIKMKFSFQKIIKFVTPFKHIMDRNIF